MKYAIMTTMRFKYKGTRDQMFTLLKSQLSETFEGDDAYIQTHRCFHDETPNKPCEVEEMIRARKNEIRRV